MAGGGGILNIFEYKPLQAKFTLKPQKIIRIMGTWKQGRSRKPLTLDKLKLRLTDAIGEMERIIMTDESDQKKIQAANTLAGLSSRYHKLLEVTDLEERITELEEKYKNRMRKVS